MRKLILCLVLCIIFGCFGLHKFLEGKILLGIIYLLTGGLFGAGIFLDCVIYIIKIIKTNRLIKEGRLNEEK